MNCGGWRDVSRVKSTGCSCKRPGFSSQQPCAAHTQLPLQLPGSQCPLLASPSTRHEHGTQSYTWTADGLWEVFIILLTSEIKWDRYAFAQVFGVTSPVPSRWKKSLEPQTCLIWMKSSVDSTFCGPHLCFWPEGSAAFISVWNANTCTLFWGSCVVWMLFSLTDGLELLAKPLVFICGENVLFLCSMCASAPACLCGVRDWLHEFPLFLPCGLETKEGLTSGYVWASIYIHWAIAPARMSVTLLQIISFLTSNDLCLLK